MSGASKIGFPEISELLPNLYLVSSSLANATPRTSSYYTSNVYALRGSQSAAAYKRNMYSSAVGIVSGISANINSTTTIAKANTILIKAAASERANEMALLKYYFKDFEKIKSHKEEYGWGEIGKAYTEVMSMYDKILSTNGEALNYKELVNFYPKVTKLMTLARSGIQNGKKTIAELKAARNAVNSELDEVYVDRNGKIVTHRNAAGELSGKSDLIQVKGGDIQVGSGSAYKTNYIMMASSNIQQSLRDFKKGNNATSKQYKNVADEMGGVFAKNIRSLVIKELMTNQSFIDSCKEAVANSIMGSGNFMVDPSVVTKYILSASSSLILEVTREISASYKMPLEDITKKYQVDENLRKEKGNEYAYSKAYKTLEDDFNKAIERLKSNTNTSLGMIETGQYERYQQLMDDAAAVFGIKINDTSKTKVSARSITKASFERQLDKISSDFLSKLSSIQANTKKLEDEENQIYKNYGSQSFDAFNMQSLFDELSNNFNLQSIQDGISIHVEGTNQFRGLTAEFVDVLVSMLNGGSSTKVRGSALTDTVSVLIDYNDKSMRSNKVTERNMDYSRRRKSASMSYLPQYDKDARSRITSIRNTEASYSKQIADQLSKSITSAQRTSRMLTQKRNTALTSLRNGILDTENKLEEAVKGYEDLLGADSGDLNNIFVIHNSIKEYQSVLQGGVGKSKKFSHFQGREGNLFNMLETLAGEANATLGADGLQQLKFAAINSHLAPGIGTILGNYLAKFAAMILFDDYSLIEEQEVGAAVQSTNVKNIHLFPLNGVYVPLSMILTYMSDQVNKTNKMMQTLAKNPQDLVNVTISGLNSSTGIAMADAAADSYFPRDPNTGESMVKDVAGFRAAWEGPGDAVAAELQAKITFLSSFLDFINFL